MRKRYRVVILAAIVAAFVVPVGFALSLESGPIGTRAPQGAIGVPAAMAATRVVAPVAVHHAPAESSGLPISDGAALFVAGSALFGIAAAVRRAA